MEYEKKEQVIFVKDLLFAALYQWRKVLISAMVCAILFGGLSFLMQKKTVEESNSPAMQAAYSEYLDQKETLENNLAISEGLLNKQLDYHENSPIMQIDPYGVYQASIELTVQTAYPALPNVVEHEYPDYTGALLRSYEVAIQNNQLKTDIATKLEIPVKYVGETIAIKNGGTETRSLSICISYYNEEGANIILEALSSYLKQTQPKIAQDVYDHEVKIVASHACETVCMDFNSLQYNANVRRDNLQANTDAVQAELTALQAPSITQSASKKQLVLFAVIGAILGAGLIACAAWLSHIAGGKIYSARTLSNKTGIRILGNVPATTSCSIDKWLKKLEGRSLGCEQAALTAANIRYYCSEAKSLLLIMDCAEELCQPLLAAIADAGITVKFFPSPLQSAETLAAIPDSDAVIVIGQCGVSRYSDAEKIQTLLNDQNKPLEGYVLLDG